MRHFLSTCVLACASLAHAQTLELAQARELDLDGLRGLGPATTQRILSERERAPFRDWADLMQRVPGIGTRKAAQLSAQGLRINGQSHPPGDAKAPQMPDPAGPAQSRGQ